MTEEWKKRISAVGQFIVLSLFVAATVASIVLGSWLNTSSRMMKGYKREFFTVNKIKYGFLNGHNWSVQVEEIIEQKIDSFSFTPKNKQVLQEQVSGIMNELVDQVDVLLHERKEKLSARIKVGAIRMFVDLDKVRAKIPHFASIAVAEIEKSGNRDKVRDLVKEKVEDLLLSKHKYVITEQERILHKYHFEVLDDFNKYIQYKTNLIEQQQRVWGYELISIMGFLLLFWWLLIKSKFRQVYAAAFLLSVLISFVDLYTGINLPMLEIDARISTLDLEILSSHVVFHDQVLFYQSKSILDVAMVLMTKGKVGSIIVGTLILVFSVLFPVVKLISATIYLYSKKKSNQFVQVMAFKSGKWSMADVMVVAIFIAYVGFESIINEQLQHISMKAVEAEHVNLLTTNRSNLQVGFMVFLAFVLFNLILAMILKRITRTEEPRFRFASWWKERRTAVKAGEIGIFAPLPHHRRWGKGSGQENGPANENN